MTHVPDVAHYGKNKVMDAVDKVDSKVTAKINSASAYMGKSLRTLKDEEDFNKVRNEQRSKERKEKQAEFERKISTQASIDRNIKALNKRREVG